MVFAISRTCSYFVVVGALVIANTALAGGIRGMRNPQMNGAMTGGDSGECSVSHVRMCDGCRINVSMRVTAGQTCHLSLRSPRPLLSHSLVERPLHGQYGSSNVSDAAYAAPAGFAGSDSFVLSIYRVAVDNQKARETRMNVRVEVVP